MNVRPAVAALVATGHTDSAIADQLGIHRTTAYRTRRRITDGHQTPLTGSSPKHSPPAASPTTGPCPAGPGPPPNKPPTALNSSPPSDLPARPPPERNRRHARSAPSVR